MTRLLVIGISPLPVDRSRRHAAPGLRAWQFTRALLGEGHAVCLATLGERHGQPAGHAGLRRVSLAPGDFSDGARLGRLLAEAAPDAVVAAGSYQPTAAALALVDTLLGGDLPLWIDLPGDMMAEAQLRALDAGSAAPLTDYLSILLPALERGDRFSAVSRRQRLALLGQLGLAGRLGPGTVGEELVAHIPPAVEPAPRAWPRVPPARIPADAFVVLSSGGYNTWCDVETLFAGLEGAMDRDSRIHMVSAGGGIEHHCEGRYRRLQELVAGSPHAGRFHLLGWQRPEELAALYAASHLGLNMDLPCAEAELGSRNRILDWLRHGLPCLTTPLTELADELCARGLAWPVAPADPGELARRLLELAGDPARLRQAGEAARAAIPAEYSPAVTAAPLLRWARQPGRAGDHGAASPRRGARPELLAAELARAEAQLRALRGGLAYRGLRRAEDLLDPALRWLKSRKN